MMSRITLNIRRHMNVSEMTPPSLGILPQWSLVGVGKESGGIARDGWQPQGVIQSVIDISSPRAASSEEAEGYEAGPMAFL